MNEVAVAAVAPGWPYNLLVLLHIICAVAGFGALIYRSLVLDLGRRRGAAAAAGVLAVYGQISQIGEVLVYGAGAFGAAAVAVGAPGTNFDQAWVWVSIAVLVLMVGVLHGLVHPGERRYRAAMLELAQMPAVAPPARPPQLAELDRLYRRIGAGMGTFNVLVLAALYLMVFKP